MLGFDGSNPVRTPNRTYIEPNLYRTRFGSGFGRLAEPQKWFGSRFGEKLPEPYPNRTSRTIQDPQGIRKPELDVDEVDSFGRS